MAVALGRPRQIRDSLSGDALHLQLVPQGRTSLYRINGSSPTRQPWRLSSESVLRRSSPDLCSDLKFPSQWLWTQV